MQAPSLAYSWRLAPWRRTRPVALDLGLAPGDEAYSKAGSARGRSLLGVETSPIPAFPHSRIPAFPHSRRELDRALMV